MRIRFTAHAEQRMKMRGIDRSWVLGALRNPDKASKQGEAQLFRKETPHGTIEVCAERRESDIKVITVYWV